MTEEALDFVVEVEEALLNPLLRELLLEVQWGSRGITFTGLSGIFTFPCTGRFFPCSSPRASLSPAAAVTVFAGSARPRLPVTSRSVFAGATLPAAAPNLGRRELRKRCLKEARVESEAGALSLSSPLLAIDWSSTSVEWITSKEEEESRRRLRRASAGETLARDWRRREAEGGGEGGPVAVLVPLFLALVEPGVEEEAEGASRPGRCCR